MQHELLARNSTEMFRFSAIEIAAMHADGNYCNITLTDGSRELLPFKLGHMERLCHEQLGPYRENFIRIGRSVIINIEYIYNINIPERRIIMRTPGGQKIRIDHLPPEAMKALKMFMERNIPINEEDNPQENNE